MATPLRHVRLFGRISAQCTPRYCLAHSSRPFTSSSTRAAQDDKTNDGQLRKLFDANLPTYLREGDESSLEGLPEGWKDSLEGIETDMEAAEADYDDVFRQALGDHKEERYDITDAEAASLLDEESLEREPRWPEGFFALDEEREDPGEDPEFENDDITSTAHGELEEHREMREFARVMAWDMPLLYNHIQPFKAPTSAQPLRFRYTTYLGEEHPAAKKVVLTFSPGQLSNLTDQQRNKLIKLLGVRYNPSLQSAKLSCELYPTPAQNKRYLGDLLDKLLTEARDGRDTMEDVPFDFRHHKPKPRQLFPEEWKMTEERRAQLEKGRREVRDREFERRQGGEVVEGTKVIEAMLAAPKEKREKEKAPVMMVAGMEQKGGNQKRRIMKRQ